MDEAVFLQILNSLLEKAKKKKNELDYGDINGIIAHIADIADYDARSISESAIEEYSQSTMANLFYNLYQSSKGIFSV